MLVAVAFSCRRWRRFAPRVHATRPRIEPSSATKRRFRDLQSQHPHAREIHGPISRCITITYVAPPSNDSTSTMRQPCAPSWSPIRSTPPSESTRRTCVSTGRARHPVSSASSSHGDAERQRRSARPRSSANGDRSASIAGQPGSWLLGCCDHGARHPLHAWLRARLRGLRDRPFMSSTAQSRRRARSTTGSRASSPSATFAARGQACVRGSMEPPEWFADHQHERKSGRRSRARSTTDPTDRKNEQQLSMRAQTKAVNYLVAELDSGR